MLSSSHQRFCHTEEQLTSWMPFLSVVLICLNTGQQLTRWMCVQPFLSWFWSSQPLKKDSLAGCIFSGSDLLKYQRATHSLDVCSAILVSGSDFLNHWRDSLAGCMFNVSDLLKHWGMTYSLSVCLAILIHVSDLSNTGEQLTSWIHV